MNSGKILLECGFHPFEDESSIQHGITENHEVHKIQSVSKTSGFPSKELKILLAPTM